jgi:hypothetical protein
VSVCAERQACSTRPPTIVPRQGIFHRWGMRPGSVPVPHLARQTRVVETTFYPRSCNFARPAVVVRFSLFLTRQRSAAVAFTTETRDLDRCKFRAGVQIDSASTSHGEEVIRDVVVITRKAPVSYYYYEGARHCQTRHFALRQRLARTYVCLYEDNQAVVSVIKNHTSSSPLIDNERVTSFDDLTGTTRHPISVSVYPQRAQSRRLLFKADRPRRVDVVVLRSPYVHAASGSDVSQKYLGRCLRVSTVKNDISIRLQTLRSRDTGRGWTIARMEQRNRLVEPVVDFVARRHLQAPRGAPNSCTYRFLWVGCRESTKVSYSGKWIRFVNF